MAQTDNADNLPENLNDLMKKETFIPGWPDGATMKIKLGKRDIYLPVKSKSGLLEMKRRKALVTCHIGEKGGVSFELRSVKIRSVLNGFVASGILIPVGIILALLDPALLHLSLYLYGVFYRLLYRTPFLGREC